MDLGEIYKSIQILTIFCDHELTFIFIYADDYLCTENARVGDMLHKRYHTSSKPKNFIVALLFCSVIVVLRSRKYFLAHITNPDKVRKYFTE